MKKLYFILFLPLSLYAGRIFKRSATLSLQQFHDEHHRSNVQQTFGFRPLLCKLSPHDTPQSTLPQRQRVLGLDKEQKPCIIIIKKEYYPEDRSSSQKNLHMKAFIPLPELVGCIYPSPYQYEIDSIIFRSRGYIEDPHDWKLTPAERDEFDM